MIHATSSRASLRQLLQRSRPHCIYATVRKYTSSPILQKTKEPATRADKLKNASYVKTARRPREGQTPAPEPRSNVATRAWQLAERVYRARSQLWERSWPLISGVALGFIIFGTVTHFIITVRTVAGPSMLPTLPIRGDLILLSYLHPHWLPIRVGDLVSFKNPMNGSRSVKRVLGLPGDLVLRDTPPGVADNFWIEGDAARWEKEIRGEHGPGWMVRVPPGHCWVVGDDLPWSRDSRHFGALPLNLVVGKVLARNPRQSWMWPFSDWTWFNADKDLEDID